MVLGVCRRLLGNEQDAEDSFQATFLVLARKAESVSWQDDIGNWLYTVACRIARKLRSSGRRRDRVSPPDLPDLPGSPDPDSDLDRQELRSVLDEELGRLPEKYRVPIVLCYLEGKSYGEAARLLGWAEGTVSGRLARARDLLRGRLARRGLAPTGAALAAVLVAGPAVPAALAAATARSALAFATVPAVPSGAVSPHIVELAEGALRSMTLTKAKIAVALLLMACLAGTGIGVLATQPPRTATPRRANHRRRSRRDLTGQHDRLCPRPGRADGRPTPLPAPYRSRCTTTDPVFQRPTTSRTRERSLPCSPR
jgi:RNA polymerase sigma factor (sigma-70 family)